MDDPAAAWPALVRAGDADAFGAVYDSCAKAVYNHAFRLLGNWAAAEDVMAQTFLEAWRSRGRIDPDCTSLRPWLLGIATNLARGQRRSSQRNVAALSRLGPAPDIPDFSDDAAGRLDDAARIAALHRSLSHLRPEEFEVLALCAWSDLSYAEAASALGVPVGTVRSRLSRARAKLLKLTEREVRRGSRALGRNSRELTITPDQLTDGTANAAPSFKEARQ